MQARIQHLSALALLALSSSAQDSVPVNAFGLEHSALGQAQVRVDPVTNKLEISNLGSSGLDGVSIKMPCDQGIDIFNSPFTLAPGGSLRYDFMAMDPATGQKGTVCSIRGIERNGRYDYDFDFPGANTMRVEAYLGEQLVYAKSGHTGSDWWWIVAGAIIANADAHVEYSQSQGWSGGVSWGSTGGTTIQIAGPAGAQVFCDLVVVRPEPHTIPYTMAFGAELRIAGTPTFEIESERLVRFDHALTAQGQAHFEQSPTGKLKVSNLGSSGCDGFSIAAPEPDDMDEGVRVELAPIGPTAPGSYLEFSGTGDLNGVSGSSLGGLRQTSSGSAVVLTADFSVLGSQTQVVEVFDQGTLVASYPGHSGPIARTSRFSHGGGLIRWWPGSTGSITDGCCWDLPFPIGTTFLMGGSATGAQVVGDEIRVRPEVSGGALTGVETMDLRTSGIQEFEVAGMSKPISPFGFETYCVAKMNSLGCSPSISASGTPSASATSGFTVTTTQLRNNKAGLFFHTVNGTRNSTPFQCGLLCVGPTGLRRTPAKFAGGSPAPTSDCSGAVSLDMNCFAQGLCGGNPSAGLLTAGNEVHVQTWGRDQGYTPPCNTTLSNALEYTIQP